MSTKADLNIQLEVLESETRTDNFPPLKNDLILRAARGERTERVPVWIMRQAGRYLPEYLEVRKHYGFIEKCRTPALACELTLQPLRRFDFDAAIIFSDILVVPEALGLKLKETPNGPKYEKNLENVEDLSMLNSTVDVDEALGFVFKAVTLTRHRMQGKCVLYGFAGAPWTLMAYMIEGGNSHAFMKPKRWLYAHPEASHRLLQMLTDVIVKYLIGQAKAGAQILQVFESNGGILGAEQFTKFALPYLTQIVTRVKQGLRDIGMTPVPMVVFAKGSHYATEQLSNSGYDVVGLDWTIDPLVARQEAGDNVSLQGNIDPCIVYAPKEEIREKTRQMLTKFGTQKYIANFGHGIYKDSDPESVREFVNAVHDISEEMNASA